AQGARTLDGTTYAGSPPALGGTVPADGTTATPYTVTGATPGALLTVTSTLGAVTTADGGPTYTGLQVVASAGGVATFTITSPSSASSVTGTITVADVTGAKVGAFTQSYAGVVPPPPPTSPPGAV